MREVVGAELAQSLIGAGVPVIVCRPNRRWQPGESRELWMPSGWHLLSAKECDIAGFRPGLDTLALVGGHGVDVVDVDTKDGGTVDNLPPFQSFGLCRTPSGGWHYVVRSTGLGKVSPLTTSAGHVGDYVGGTREGGGRMLAYLPGSTRPKYPDRTYEVVEPWDLEALMESEPDEDLVAALIGAGAARDGRAGAPAKSNDVVRAFVEAHRTQNTAPCAYGRTAVNSLLQDRRGIVEGDSRKGRHGWAIRSACRLVELMFAGCATSYDVDVLSQELARIKPEEDWSAAIGWALANVDPDENCTVHVSRGRVRRMRSDGSLQGVTLGGAS